MKKNAIGWIQTSLIIMDSQFDNIKLGAINSNGKSKIDIINCTFSNIPYTYAIFSNDDKYVIKNCSFKKVLIGICFNQWLCHS